ncbi:MAG: hypothetical protein FWC36_08885 [Spirochaetes bacterium]|nr:hypothetical protein [Spirochaetota bacterium]
MKKIIGLMVLITLIGTTSVFAHGRESRCCRDSRESRNPHGARQAHRQTNQHHTMHPPGVHVIEVREITGEIIIRDNNRHIIKSGDKETRIILSSDAIQTLGLENGSVISVKGIVMPTRRTPAAERTIRVFEVQHDGRKFLVLNKRASIERANRVTRGHRDTVEPKRSKRTR